eukprot:COSAG02_NODE_108_length_36286_cov_19.437478_13_plen_105_part_00
MAPHASCNHLVIRESCAFASLILIVTLCVPNVLMCASTPLQSPLLTLLLTQLCWNCLGRAGRPVVVGCNAPGYGADLSHCCRQITCMLCEELGVPALRCEKKAV